MTIQGEPPGLVLEYDDPWAPTIEPDAIIHRAQRQRRGYRLAKTAVALTVLVASLALVDSFNIGRTPTLSALELAVRSAPYREHPALFGPMVVDQSVPHWASVAWIGVDNQFWYGSVSTATSGPDRGLMALHSGGSVYNRLHDPVPFVMLPAFQPFPPSDQSHGKVLVIGLAGRSVSKVSMTFRGQQYTVRVIPLADNLGVYAAWLAIGGAGAYGSRDITDLAGLDKAGRVVA